LAAGCLLLATAGCTTLDTHSSDSAASDSTPAAPSATVSALVAAGDPDALEAAALLQASGGDPERQLQWLARAAAAAPNRPDLVWLELRTCDRIVGCDLRPLQAQLHWLDPDNAAPWSVALSLERRSGQEAAFQEDLVAISYSKRFDIYWNQTVEHATHAVMRVQGLDARASLLQIVGVEAAVAIPAYHPLIASCRQDAPAGPDAVATCRRIADVLRSGDTYITEMAGLGIAMRAWPDGSDERGEARHELHIEHYRMDQEFRRSVAYTPSDQEARQLLQLLATHRTEQEAYVADLERAGISPEPPADWTEPPMWSR